MKTKVAILKVWNREDIDLIPMFAKVNVQCVQEYCMFKQVLQSSPNV